MDLGKAVRDPWVWAQLALFVLVGVGAPLVGRAGLLAHLGGTSPAPLRHLGFLLVALGLGLAVWAGATLGPALTPGTEPLAGAPLVRRGPYTAVRHPIYLGIVLALTGWTLRCTNPVLALLVLLGSGWLLEGKARVEERWLRARHPEYAEYARRVRRRVMFSG